MPNSERPLRIVTITADEPHHECIAALLGSRFELVGRVIEPGGWRRKRMLQRRRLRSWFWFTYQFWRRKLAGLTRQRANFFAEKADRSVLRGVPTCTVRSVNDRESISAIRAWNPEVTIVCGTSILRSEILSATGGMTINVHGGLLPYYRGNHCYFFAFTDGRFERIGSSIHFVDSGIDTGDLIETVCPSIEPHDTPESLYCKGDWLAFQRLVILLSEFESTGVLPRSPQSSEGREYKMRDRTLWLDMCHWWRRRVGHGGKWRSKTVNISA
jgi:hypothetical protein